LLTGRHFATPHMALAATGRMKMAEVSLIKRIL